jgi:hypothetical protein
MCASRGITLVAVEKELFQNVQPRVLAGLPWRAGLRFR